jgi:hypothetical protein
LAGLIAISAVDERAERTFECHDLISDGSKAGKWWGTAQKAIDHYVMIDFKDYRIRPSGYSVKTHNSSWSSTGLFVKSWRFEGSTDGTAWQALDSHTNSSELSGNDREVSFACQSPSQFRFVRFLMVGDSSGNRQFSLQRLEVFGVLISTGSK